MKFERPLEGQELDLLEGMLDPTRIKLRRLVKFLLVWTSLPLVVGTIVYFKIEPDSKIVLYLTVASYIGVGVWIFVEQRVQLRRKEKSIAFLKSKNLVTVVRVRSDTYYLLDEQEDEGVFYLFQLPDNQVFSFGGQDFYETEEFPSDSFDIVEGRGINAELLILETYVYGQKIAPAKVISGAAKWALLHRPDYPDPSRLTVVKGSIGEFA
jgi:hypothetical protein